MIEKGMERAEEKEREEEIKRKRSGRKKFSRAIELSFFRPAREREGGREGEKNLSFFPARERGREGGREKFVFLPCEREREGGRERGRERGREGEREGGREGGREGKREGERGRQREGRDGGSVRTNYSCEVTIHADEHSRIES